MSQFITLEIIFIGLFAGITAAAIIATVVRNTVAKTVHRLIDSGAVDKASAMTADELGLGKLGRRILRGQLYGKIIFCQNEFEVRTDKNLPPKKQNPYKNPPLNMSEARFYIPEDKHFQAGERYPKRGTTVVTLIIGIVMLAVFFGLAYLAAPYLINMAKSLFS